MLQLYQAAGPAAGLPSNTTALVMPNSGATFDINSNTQAVASLSGVAGTNILLGFGSLTAGSDNTSTTYSGVISGSGSLVKAGSGQRLSSMAATRTHRRNDDLGRHAADRAGHADRVDCREC